jgi:hypothetical protein
LTAPLVPAAGFDWAKVKWGAPDAPRSDYCSYCRVLISDEDVTLMMWDKDGACAQFCDACQQTWWGLESFEAPDDEDDEPELE